MFKEKIFETLKTKYKDIGVSKEVLEGVATNLSAFVKEETQIEPAVNGAETMLRTLQSYADNRVNTFKNESEKYKKEAEELKTRLAGLKKTPEQEEKGGFSEQLFAEKLAEAMKPFQEKLQQLESKEKADTRKAFIGAKVKELGIPEWRVNEGFAINDQMDETQIVTYLSNIKQNIQTAGLQDKKGLPLDDTGKPNSEEVKSIINNIM
ncbi:hypothetical protein CAPN008_01330 [Capnocytophaga canis]|uniref:hypothetical protein n=1 Tax=Capnocytophaga canis TaxID=1848903 RepID=UPI001AD5EF77|nr:hypothetical protein [Capnocytophaga canis]GIM60083.1 hypothetical protein CAPN008_01330 [Capnocytophaga canis]